MDLTNADLLRSIISMNEGEGGAGGGTGGTTTETPPAEKPEGEQGKEGGQEADPPGAEHLGDPGKKALDTMKGERNAARELAASEKARADALQAQIDGKQAEHQAELDRQRVRDEALAVANQRILKAELRAAASGKLANAEDALAFLDLSTFEVDDNGNVDHAAITAELDKLITNRPYLAAQGGARFQGSADGGARTGPPGKSMQDQIAEAEQAGDIPKAIRLRQELAAKVAAEAAKK